MNDNEVISSKDGFNEFHLANYDPTAFKSGIYHYLHRSATQGLTKRPANKETELDPGLVCLQGWFDYQNTCCDLRSERGGIDLSTARMMVLDQAKFPWLLTLGESWQKGFNELVKFKEEHRSTRVPRSHDLGNWVSNQRRIKKNNNMSKARVDKLKEIGFEWTLNKSWGERFAELVSFCGSHGHCRVSRHNDSHDTKLAKWVSDQRSNNKKKNRGEDKIKKLEKIGFELEL